MKQAKKADKALEAAIIALQRDFSAGVDWTLIRELRNPESAIEGLFRKEEREITMLHKLHKEWWQDLISNGYDPIKN
jgi:translation initiation factor 2 alpha subunit (eIF-2alpha)